ncbi:PepSY domain-containing protein [Methylosinus sp. Sm6]|uniref:PepSY-associated TM helix domain-containing protein n=1 Tax=Methylosinus sp. Sm6 TaxID=2866948 RepID=UPI001C9900B5|nr:PepSY-associated TM helix domain-containing protein [Methylosinus sp. Sm6]MBY6242117.1 PepSY domain-containing protein [Methylosinus sp. Sm6]
MLDNAPHDARARRSRKEWRKLWLDVHLYIGLVAGAMLVVIGVTGGILVFWHEVDAWLDPQLRIVAARAGGAAAFAPLERIERAMIAATPAEGKITHVWLPRDERSSYLFYYDLDGETRRFGIDPYDATKTADRLYYSKVSPFRHALMGFLFQLHWSLLLSDLADDGGVVVGVAAILLMISTLAGVYLWWPAPGKWIVALTLKRGARAERLNYDLHKLGGVYSAAVLLAVLMSGVYMNLPTPFLWIVDHVAPLTDGGRPTRASEPAAGRSSIGFPAAVAAAHARSPEGHVERVDFPGGEQGVFTVYQDDVTGVGPFIRSRSLLVDRYSAAVLSIDDVTQGTAGDAFLRWQWPLHSGRAFGLTGRLLVLASGLLCVLLFVTGVIRWLQKRRARRAAQRL